MKTLSSDTNVVRTVEPDGSIKYNRSNGLLHRLNGPAIVWADGTEEWWVNGRHHRDDGPAIIGNESRRWCQDGKFHRLDGPAIEWADGTEEWWVEGGLHRTDGPAVVKSNGKGKHEWWVDGRQLSLNGRKQIVILLASKLCNVTVLELQRLPFSEVESILYAFSGWKRY
jgi:hypothetical protein